MVGVEGHKAFLKKMGQLDRLRTELPESAEPLVPKHWGELNTMTIAFGQGLNVAPMQAVMAVAALVNGGNMMTPTFLHAQPRRRRDKAQPPRDQRRRPPNRCAISCAPTPTHGSAEFRQHSGLLRRRQDRHRRQDRPRPLFEGQGFHHFHGDHAGRQAEISLSGRSTTIRSAAPEDDGFHTAALERRPDHRRADPTRRAAGGRAADEGSANHPFPIIARLGYGADADKIGKE